MYTRREASFLKDYTFLRFKPYGLRSDLCQTLFVPKLGRFEPNKSKCKAPLAYQQASALRQLVGHTSLHLNNKHII